MGPHRNGVAQPAPDRRRTRRGTQDLFATPIDPVLTVLGLLFATWALSRSWLGDLQRAVTHDRTACLTVTSGALPSGWSGARASSTKFAHVRALSGRERWRVILTGIVFVALLAPLLIPRAPYKRLNAILFFAVFPFIAFWLLIGGFLGLSYVETPLWGGLLVTLVLSYVGIVVSLPLGVLLALGRRSKMPAVKMLSVIFIEAVRGVPLETTLIMASLMLPLFVPPGMTFDSSACPDRRRFCLGLYGRSSARRPAGDSKASTKARIRSVSAIGRRCA